MLFAEASVKQIRVIRKVLEEFCTTSGQKVSLEKSKIFFSKNVSRDMEALITRESGIRATRELGKYLGMPILQKRMNKDTFSEVLERVSSKLAGWKGRCMSLAGRLTLTKAVLLSIPVHTMSTIYMPQVTLNALDQVSRSFLWGSTTEKKKQHLIAWNKVCLPKREGGIGIRKSKDMNKALLAKVGWRLLHDKTSLWARVIHCKYKVGDTRNVLWLKPKSTWSSTWRSIASGLRDVILHGQKWLLGNGRVIKFWQDKWLTHEPLLNHLVIELPQGREEELVRDVWGDRGWLWSRIRPYVPEDIRLQLGALVVDNVTGARDRLSWGESLNGSFSVRSAYDMITRNTNPSTNMEQFWNRVWRVRVPERIKLFLWLVGNKAIMTNSERHRRHLCDSSICQICKSGEETIIHILRDCPAMEGIWQRIVPSGKRQLFFSQPLLEWLFYNLRSDSNTTEQRWATLFGVAVWWAWKWRCGNVFGTTEKCRDRVKFIKDWAVEANKAHLAIKGPKVGMVHVERMIAWVPPQSGWLKINTDGASRGNPGLAAAGGVLRDEAGAWVSGFALNIGICSAPIAELWGVYYGMYIAWEERATCLEVEVDSEMVVKLLKTGVSDTHPLSFLVRLCHGFISRDWIVRISHIYREANRLADALANYAFSLHSGFHLVESVPDSMNTLMSDDVHGAVTLRQICI